MNYVEEWVTSYEQEHGRKLTELVIQVVKHIDKVGDMLKVQGQKDAQEGKKPYSIDAFLALVRKVFHNVLEDATTKEIADLWQSDYMDGYEGVEK